MAETHARPRLGRSGSPHCRGGRKPGPQPEAGNRSLGAIEANHRRMVTRLLDQGAVTVSDDEWDALIRDWNQLAERHRRAFAAACTTEGHVDALTSAGLWVCARCLRYVRPEE